MPLLPPAQFPPHQAARWCRPLAGAPFLAACALLIAIALPSCLSAPSRPSDLLANQPSPPALPFAANPFASSINCVSYAPCATHPTTTLIYCMRNVSQETGSLQGLHNSTIFPLKTEVGSLLTPDALAVGTGFSGAGAPVAGAGQWRAEPFLDLCPSYGRMGGLVLNYAGFRSPLCSALSCRHAALPRCRATWALCALG